MLLKTFRYFVLGIVLTLISMGGEGVCFSCVFASKGCECALKPHAARKAPSKATKTHTCKACDRSSKSKESSQCSCPPVIDKAVEANYEVAAAPFHAQLFHGNLLSALSQYICFVAVLPEKITPGYSLHKDTLYPNPLNEPLFITHCLFLI